MKEAALGALLMASTACAVAPPPEPEVPVHGGGGSCNERAAQSRVGRTASSGLAAEAQRLTGARTTRWIRPDDVVTMEFNPGRLNIYLDGQNRVKRLSCG